MERLLKRILFSLRRWIAWQTALPRSAAPLRWLAALATVPAILALSVCLAIYARGRAPLSVPGTIPGGARLPCQLPDVVQLYIFLFGVWEPDITAFVRRRLVAGDLFADIGAHIGYYALVAAAEVGPAGRVIAVEAMPGIFGALRENLERQGALNVHAIHAAAASQIGQVATYRGPAWNLGWSTTHAGRGLPRAEPVPAAPLDELLAGEPWSRLRLIKVDVEGTERELFDGLLRILHHGGPATEVILELSPRWWTDRQPIEVALQPFFDAGFHAYRIDNQYSPWRYLWPERVRPPRRIRAPIRSWIGQLDVVLSRIDDETL